jgi:hypothetical protein
MTFMHCKELAIAVSAAAIVTLQLASSSSSIKGSNAAFPDSDTAQSNCKQKPIKLYPVDEGDRDPTFLIFRQRLLEAVKKRDAKYIRTILDPHITNTFGGDGGIDEFFERWKPESKETGLWEELTTILTLGGSFQEQGKPIFCAPYVFSRWDSIESYLTDTEASYAAIIGDGVKLRSAANNSSEVKAELHYDVVKLDYKNSVREPLKEKYAWLNVVTLAGERGYVSARFVRDPLDYRACFEKSGETWYMTHFVAGD